MKGGATMNDEQQKMLEKIEHNQGTIMLFLILITILLFIIVGIASYFFIELYNLVGQGHHIIG